VGRRAWVHQGAAIITGWIISIMVGDHLFHTRIF
jgi:hypothetical protein